MFLFLISSNFFVSQYFVVIISHNAFVFGHDRNAMRVFDFGGMFLYFLVCWVKHVEYVRQIVAKICAKSRKFKLFFLKKYIKKKICKLFCIYLFSKTLYKNTYAVPYFSL